LFDHEAINSKKEPTTITSAPKLYKPQAFVSVSKPVQSESKTEDSAEKLEKNEVKYFSICIINDAFNKLIHIYII
jgi:hypothetical protein